MERKLPDFSLLEKMKFSHSIQFNAVPDWSGHYISYSNLKKLYASDSFNVLSPRGKHSIEVTRDSD